MDKISLIQPYLIVIWYTVVSLITCVVYAIDKNAARRRWRRIPELHLHLLALFGGWPGAVLAQQALRHKSVKQRFRMMTLLIVLLNIAVLVWLIGSPHSPMSFS